MHLFTTNKLGGSVEILMMMKTPRKLPLIIIKYFHFITSHLHILKFLFSVQQKPL